MTQLALPRTWPLVQEDADPWAPDVWLEEGDDAFATAWNRAMRGAASFDQLRAVAAAAGLDGPLTHDWEAAEPATQVVPDSLLAAVLEDFVPDVVPLLDVVLGPWADERPDRTLRIAAAASLSQVPVLSPTISAMRAWANRPPKPDLALRASVWAARDAPPMLWATSDTTPWTPLLPLAPCWKPDTPTALPAARLGGTELALARLYPCADGQWRASAAIGLPSGVPVARVRTRMEAELWRLRRSGRKATWEDALRARPQVLYRSCATWSWWHCEEP